MEKWGAREDILKMGEVMVYLISDGRNDLVEWKIDWGHGVGTARAISLSE